MKFSDKYIKKYWKLFCLSVLCLIVEASCDLMQPTIMSKIVDIGVAKNDMDFILQKGGVMLLITFIGACAAVGRNIISSNVSIKFGADLRLDLFKKIQSFSFENIDNFETASLVTRITNDVSQLQNFANGLMRIFIKAPLLCIGSIVMAIRLDPHMAIILLVVVPLVGFLISINMRIGYPFFSKVQKSLDKVNSVSREYLSGVRVVKAFNRFHYEENRFDKVNKEQGATAISAMQAMAIFSPAITLTVNFGIVAILMLGGVRVDNGNMKVGQVIAFINYMNQILFSLLIISVVISSFARARASAERIGEVFLQEDSMEIPEEPMITCSIKGRIDFEQVCFSYSNSSGEAMLKDISFTCMPGETIGIIGSTGSGKSSLVNLIPRFYEVSSGTVKVDGIDVRKLDSKVLRDKIALVPQKTTLFTGSIIDNIRWGNRNSTIEEVEKATQMAEAHQFICSFPEGYNTLLGQGGVNLSGGQKQRISIARALVKHPEILILDDCTNAVDVATEIRIREALKEYSKELTCIVIAQRITSVIQADRIIVLENGDMVGIGTHKELLRGCSVYLEIFNSQLGGGVNFE